VTAIALCSSSLATDEPTIQAADAAQHVGGTVVVHGTVVEVYPFKGGSIALDDVENILRQLSSFEGVTQCK